MWAAWAPAIVVVLASVFNAGLLFQRVSSHDKRLDGHDERLDGHEERLQDHSVRIERTEAWHRGYNAAKDTHRAG